MSKRQKDFRAAARVAKIQATRDARAAARTAAIRTLAAIGQSPEAWDRLRDLSRRRESAYSPIWRRRQWRLTRLPWRVTPGIHWIPGKGFYLEALHGPLRWTPGP